MQKDVIHDWMQHFHPILNKYNTIKKRLKAKVAEKKELNIQKDKTSIVCSTFLIVLYSYIFFTDCVSFTVTIILQFSVHIAPPKEV